MQSNKQVKKPYLAPKCEVIQMGTYNLMGVSAEMGGFKPGGALSKEGWFEEEADFQQDFDFRTDNTQSEKEEQP